MRIGTHPSGETVHLFDSEGSLCESLEAEDSEVVDENNPRDWLNPMMVCATCVAESHFVMNNSRVGRGIRNTYTYHTDPDCLHVETAQKIIVSTEQEAVEKGREICSTCEGNERKDVYKETICGICGEEVSKLPQHLQFEHIESDI